MPPSALKGNTASGIEAPLLEACTVLHYSIYLCSGCSLTHRQLLCWQMNGLATSHLVTTCQFSTYGSYMPHTMFHTKGKWKKILLSVIRDDEKCKRPRRPRHISASGDLLHLLRQRHEIWVYKMSWEIMVTYEIKDLFSPQENGIMGMVMNVVR